MRASFVSRELGRDTEELVAIPGDICTTVELWGFYKQHFSMGALYLLLITGSISTVFHLGSVLMYPERCFSKGDFAW
jgi:hypothetical protein